MMDKNDSAQTVCFLEQSADNDNEQDKPPERGQWSSRLDFMMSCISLTVGLGNIWRFPYLCFRNGGGAFLIPFIIAMVLLGLPLFFLELAIGQFTSLGAIEVWNISPIFKGVGYGMTIVSCIMTVYYNIIIAQCLYYFGASFTPTLPWSNCNNSWNNKTLCYEGLDNFTSIFGKLFSSEEYYDNYVLNKSSSISDMGLPQWKMLTCLAVTCIIVMVFSITGVKILGKLSYFTALLPYTILTILLIRGLLLPGSLQGIIYYIKPNFSILKNPKVWVEAATQIFFSLGLCNGNLITMASYNNFKNNCCKDTILFAIIDCATSIYAGFVIFTNMGFMSHLMNVSITEVVKGGPGLAFKVYPEVICKMPLSSLWSVLFFFMMLSLGLGSQVTGVEAILSSIEDELKSIRLITTKTRAIIYRITLCMIFFLLGIPMTCRGGVYLVDLFDLSISDYTMLILALFELFVVSYVYGIDRFIKDIELMIGYKPNIFWKACWMVITPLFIVLMIISLIAFTYNQTDPFPPTFMVLQHILTSSPMIALVLTFIIYYCKNGGWFLLMENKNPVYNFGLANIGQKHNVMNGGLSATYDLVPFQKH